MQTNDITIRTILVDDEPPARDELAYLLSDFADVEIIDIAATAQQAIESIRRHLPDLVFLDIQMPGKNGFDVLENIVTMPSPPLVIFATAYDQYAIRAFEENAVDYLLKPISAKRLLTSIERIRKKLETSNAQKTEDELRAVLADVGIRSGITRISVETSGRNMLLTPQEILYFHYEEKRIWAHTQNGAFPCASETSLDRLEERLYGLHFFRANRGELINLAHVRTYAPWFNGKYIITLEHTNNTEIIISKSRVKTFRHAIEL